MNDIDELEQEIEETTKILYKLLEYKAKRMDEEDNGGNKWVSVKYEEKKKHKYFMCILAESESELVKASGMTAIHSRKDNQPSFELAQENLAHALNIFIANGMSIENLAEMLDDILDGLFETQDKRNLH